MQEGTMQEGTVPSVIHGNMLLPGAQPLITT